MNRRQLLAGLAVQCLGIAGPRPTPGDASAEAGDPLAGVLIIDAHAHPDQFFGRRRFDPSATLEAITALGMAASSFAALGDRQPRAAAAWESEDLHSVHRQLDVVRGLAHAGKVHLVRKAADIVQGVPGVPPGAILALEGAHPVGSDAGKVDALHAAGVRIVTLMHNASSELGDCMSCAPYHGGLSAAGRKVVERMQHLGILVDVAHADARTMAQIVDLMDRPVIDSHTSLCALDDSRKCGRVRSWSELERIARKGGVICSWPLANPRAAARRETFRDWALELLAMKERLGVECLGIGTDGGGSLPALIDGYRDERDLVKLARAMRDVGFTSTDIAAVFGANVRRVFQQSVG